MDALMNIEFYVLRIYKEIQKIFTALGPLEKPVFFSLADRAKK